MARYVVTGGLGFIGARVVAALLRRDPSCQLLVFDKWTYSASPDRLRELTPTHPVEILRGDVCDLERLREGIGAGVDMVIHCAAETHVDRSIDSPRPFVDTNIVGTYHLLELARQGFIPHLVVVSTDEVYGDPQRPSAPGDGLQPSSPYASSKAAGDLLTQAWRRTYGIHVSLTRGCNTLGPWQFPEKLVPLALLRWQRGLSMPLYGDGHHTRDWIDVDDHADGIVTTGLRGQPGAIYHLGHGQPITNLDLLTRLARVWQEEGGQLPGQPWIFVPDRPGHDHHYPLRLEEGDRPPGWFPRYSLDEALRRVVTWTLQHPRWGEERLNLPQWLHLSSEANHA